MDVAGLRRAGAAFDLITTRNMSAKWNPKRDGADFPQSVSGIDSDSLFAGEAASILRFRACLFFAAGQRGASAARR